MGNLISPFIALLFLSMLVCSCGKNLPANLKGGTLPGENAPYGSGSQFLKGSLVFTDGQTVVVNELLQKPLVLIFSQDSCIICRAETKMLVEKFVNLGGPPKNIDLYTVLIATVLEDAQDFKQSFGIPWGVGFQTNDVLFRSSCPNFKVPCVVVELPTQGFVFQKTGEFQIEEIEKYTGPWSYR